MSIDYPNTPIPSNIQGVRYPSNLVNAVNVNQKYISNLSLATKTYNPLSASISDVKPTVATLSVNHPLNNLKTLTQGPLYKTLDSGIDSFKCSMDTVALNLNVTHEQDITRELVDHIGKDSKASKTI